MSSDRSVNPFEVFANSSPASFKNLKLGMAYPTTDPLGIHQRLYSNLDYKLLKETGLVECEDSVGNYIPSSSIYNYFLSIVEQYANDLNHELAKLFSGKYILIKINYIPLHSEEGTYYRTINGVSPYDTRNGYYYRGEFIRPLSEYYMDMTEQKYDNFTSNLFRKISTKLFPGGYYCIVALPVNIVRGDMNVALKYILEIQYYRYLMDDICYDNPKVNLEDRPCQKIHFLGDDVKNMEKVSLQQRRSKTSALAHKFFDVLPAEVSRNRHLISYIHMCNPWCNFNNMTNMVGFAEAYLLGNFSLRCSERVIYNFKSYKTDLIGYIAEQNRKTFIGKYTTSCVPTTISERERTM